MFAELSTEEDSILQSVTKFAASEIPKYQNEAYYGTLPRPLFDAFAQLGLTGLSVSEKYNGIAASPLLSALVLQTIAAVDLGPAIFLAVHGMVSGLIERFGNDTQRERWLPALARGERLGAFALTEPGAGSDAGNLATSARKAGNEYRLNGEKCFITSAGWADHYLVFARTGANERGKGISAFVVDKDAQGLTIGKPEKKMGAELSPIATLAFQDTPVPEANLLGKADDGYRIALGGLAGGRINVAASAVGISEAALRIACDHLTTRKQFDKQLIEFQGLQFMLADMKLKLEASRLLVLNAAMTLARDPDSNLNRLNPAMAKCFATDAAMSITTDAVQLLGGYGYVKEFQAERLMRDAKMLQIVEGTNQIQRMVIAREMQRVNG